MPYIPQHRRKELDLALSKPANAGELNYLLTRLCLAYTADRPLNYQTMNDVTGALEAAKLEFYRRIVQHYEDHKCEINGDVYDTGA